ncbi:hypothetical protein [Methylobacterium aquaticum]|jgi:hypothetical protein|uniref:Uncharacterized protein n=1 Tax=Methylobacterium aquaticum TaxID=270351 RepID=A0A0J6SKA4_9HYPH|nr:hypothetical protein [Methylobacterium aquaticum]KMO33818.1 hypothetical protein VP06_15680 [Methylobacterium aquaticum]
MTAFRLHRGWRAPSGVVTDHVTFGETILAADADDATSTAMAETEFLLAADANFAWLTDPQGVLVWSMLLDDDDLMPGS